MFQKNELCKYIKIKIFSLPSLPFPYEAVNESPSSAMSLTGLQQPKTETASSVGTSPARSAGCGPIHRAPSSPFKLRFEPRAPSVAPENTSILGRGSRGAPMQTRASLLQTRASRVQRSVSHGEEEAHYSRSSNANWCLHQGVSGASSCRRDLNTWSCKL